MMDLNIRQKILMNKLWLNYIQYVCMYFKEKLNGPFVNKQRNSYKFNLGQDINDFELRNSEMGNCCW